MRLLGFFFAALCFFLAALGIFFAASAFGFVAALCFVFAAFTLLAALTLFAAFAIFALGAKHTFEVAEALLDARHRAHAHAGLVLLHDNPFAVSIFEGLYKSGNILLAATQRAIFENRLGSILALLLLDAYQGIRVTLLGAFKIEVLEVNHRRTVGVFAQVLSGINAGIFNPAEVELGTQQICGNGAVNIVEAIAAVFESLKLKIVIVIEQIHACILHLFGNLCDSGHGRLKLVGAGTELVGHGIEFNGQLFLYIREMGLADVFQEMIDPEKTKKITGMQLGTKTVIRGYKHLYAVTEENDEMVSAALRKS